MAESHWLAAQQGVDDVGQDHRECTGPLGWFECARGGPANSNLSQSGRAQGGMVGQSPLGGMVRHTSRMRLTPNDIIEALVDELVTGELGEQHDTLRLSREAQGVLMLDYGEAGRFRLEVTSADP